jgi:hypothetical protein
MMKIQTVLVAIIMTLLFSIAFLDDFMDESIIYILRVSFIITFLIFLSVMVYSYYKETKIEDSYNEEW